MLAQGDPSPLGGVLAGGGSRRFGSDKAATPLAGSPMAAWAAESLRAVAGDPVMLLGGSTRLAARLGLPRRPDTWGAGPLAGIAAGLGCALALGRQGLLVLACDLPLVEPEHLERIAAAADPGVDAVVPRQPGGSGFQPLCAWYGPSSLPRLLTFLERGGRSARAFVERLDARVVDLVPPGAEDFVFVNVNTPRELAEAERILAGRWGHTTSSHAAPPPP